MVATGIVPFLNLKDSSDAPLVNAMLEIGIPWAAKVISIGSLLGLTTTTFTCLLGQPRIFYTMARDVSLQPAIIAVVITHWSPLLQGLLFPVFKWTTKKTEIPLIGTLITGIFTAVLAFFMSLDSLSNAISVGTLLAFNLVNSGVIIIRYSTPKNYPFIPIALISSYVITCFISAFFFDRIHVHRGYWVISTVFAVLAFASFILLCVYHVMHPIQNIPQTFKCPLVPLVPCIGIVINSYMLAGLDRDAWIRLVVWLVIGLAIYFIYGIHKSKLNKEK